MKLLKLDCFFFKNNQPAYIAKRFDIKEDLSKYVQDDFALLDGPLPTRLFRLNIEAQFKKLAELAENSISTYIKILVGMTSKEKEVINLLQRSYLTQALKCQLRTDFFN